MNTTLHHFLTAGALTLAAVLPAANAAGEIPAAARAAVLAIAEGADARDWVRVESAFAPRVVLDYGVPELLTPAEITARWRPLFAQLGATRHELRDLAAALHAGGLRLTAAFTAAHELRGAPGGDTWTLHGRYEWEVRSLDSVARITRMRMIPEKSDGNAGLVAEALRRAGLTPPVPVITAEHVAFTSGGETLRGVLYRPAGTTAGAKSPALVVTGAWMTIQEQMPMAYVQRLAAQGVAALTFDFRGFGQSDGTIRGFEDTERKAADLVAAAAFLARQPGIDAARSGLFAMCASSGYAALAATRSPEVKRLVMAAPWLQDRALIEAVYGQFLPALRETGRAARAEYKRTGIAAVVPAASTTDRRAAMFEEKPTWLDYYVNVARGAVPTWPNEFAPMSWASWLAFDSHAYAADVKTPALLIHSEAAAIPAGARGFAAKMGRAPQQVWLDGATQFDFYDNPAVLARVVAETVRFVAPGHAATGASCSAVGE